MIMKEGVNADLCGTFLENLKLKRSLAISEENG